MGILWRSNNKAAETERLQRLEALQKRDAGRLLDGLIAELPYRIEYDTLYHLLLTLNEIRKYMEQAGVNTLKLSNTYTMVLDVGSKNHCLQLIRRNDNGV